MVGNSTSHDWSTALSGHSYLRTRFHGRILTTRPLRQQVNVQHRGFSVDPSGGMPSAVQELVHVSGPGGMSLDASTSMVGPHQHANLAAAVTALCKLREAGWSVSDAHILAGLQQAHLPARFQVRAERKDRLFRRTSY